MKKFIGWQGVKSKTGDDWDNIKNWPPITPIVKTKKEVIKLVSEYKSFDCMPRQIVKRYK